METQLKKGIIEAAVLTSLKLEDSYGYKIVQDLRPVADISESTLYPILRRLENAGCLTVYTKEYAGRLRKYYSITYKGRQRIKAFLDDFKEVNTIYEYILKT